jgi:hypothetical protein
MVEVLNALAGAKTCTCAVYPQLPLTLYMPVRGVKPATLMN